MALILLVAPIVLLAYLLGASWGLAIAIGLSAPVVAVLLAFIVIAIIDLIQTAQRKWRWRKSPRNPRNRKA
jgi:membrane protein implicated in regulation of membrane protease activity